MVYNPTIRSDKATVGVALLFRFEKHYMQSLANKIQYDCPDKKPPLGIHRWRKTKGKKTDTS